MSDYLKTVHAFGLGSKNAERRASRHGPVEIEDNKTVEERMEEISERRERLDILYKKLERSLAIQKLCPTAFEHGSCTAYWLTIKDEAAYQIRKGDGSTITFEFDDVSESIKLEEAKQRSLTGFHHLDVRNPGSNGPLGKALLKFLYRKRMDDANKVVREHHSK